ncbi:MFS transporter [Aminiphilus circumscriptus]|jgi:UMF1 family MFS transporter|uniref:MFS transporter n=1 Tax=Aminiphilus circumscriptus TaxID=290732 RepID=UPI000492A12E|nr:MFS transporter [Aminiphilus circumscriptus]
MEWRRFLRNPCQRAWVLYDVGNSAFATTIMAVLFPLFYARILAVPLGEARGAALWGYVAGGALLFSAVIAPFAGSFGDLRGKRKLGLAVFTATGVAATGGMAFLSQGTWSPGLVLLAAGIASFSLASIFYDAFLVYLAPPEERSGLSSAGYAFGYLGGGVLLVANVAMVFLLPGLLGFRLAFVSVALWWALLTLPLLRRVPEPPAEAEDADISAVWRRPLNTLRSMREHPNQLRFLVAFWLYNDGIGTIMKMGVIFGSSLGIAEGHLLGALVATQFVGIPCTMLFGRLAEVWGTKRALLTSLAGYSVISLGILFVHGVWHFWVLALSIGVVQGGAQALSRSLYAELISPERSAEYFGFYDMSSKFAGILGPFLFALLADLFGSLRVGAPVLVLFFLTGMVLLRKVEVPMRERKNATEECLVEEASKSS